MCQQCRNTYEAFLPEIERWEAEDPEDFAGAGEEMKEINRVLTRMVTATLHTMELGPTDEVSLAGWTVHSLKEYLNDITDDPDEYIGALGLMVAAMVQREVACLRVLQAPEQPNDKEEEGP